MARRRSTRINGPYKHRKRWRVLVIREDGERSARSFEKEEDAHEFVKACQSLLEGETLVSAAITRYLAWLRARGVKPVTLTNAERFLGRFFGQKTGYPLRRLTPSKAQSLYDAMLTAKHYRGTGYSAATHRGSLVEAKRFAGWCVKNKLLKMNPIADIEPTGRKRAGKEQLSGDEARKLLDFCLSAYANGKQHAIIPLLCLGLALRASEVAGLDARDVDDSGRTLRIRHSKTAAGIRRLEVADAIAVCLAHQAKDRVGQLIPGATPASVYHHVKRYCARAGVTVVCPHGLRGTHATLAAGRGATSALLMEALGHTNIAVTKRHYIQSGVLEATQGRDAWKALRPIDTDGEDDDE